MLAYSRMHGASPAKIRRYNFGRSINTGALKINHPETLFPHPEGEYLNFRSAVNDPTPPKCPAQVP